MRKITTLGIICLVAVFALSACGGDGSRLVGTWVGATGMGSQTAWRYEFNRDGTGTWGDGRNATPEPVWNQDLGRYITLWNHYAIPTTWSISGDRLEIVFEDSDSVNVYYYEFLDDDTLLLTREGRQTGLELMRIY